MQPNGMSSFCTALVSQILIQSHTHLTHDYFLLCTCAAVGWIMALSSIAMVPLVAIVRFCMTTGSLGEVSLLCHIVCVRLAIGEY